MNIGLPGKAFHSKEWTRKHQPRLLQLFTELMSHEQRVMGLLLCEVGNLSEPLDEEAKEKCEEVIKMAFHNAGATKHGDPLILGMQTTAKQWQPSKREWTRVHCRHSTT